MKWEYAFLTRTYGIGGKTELFLPDGSTHSLGVGLREVLALQNRMGTEGWEVITCSGELNFQFWTLKRPLS